MQRESSVHILWDASHIWGLMAWRALRALGVPSRLVKAKEIAEGALSGKPGSGPRARLLLVPGGSAGRKSRLLGSAGREAVRDFVRKGGAYLGFCCGAGLALSPAEVTLQAGGRPEEAPLGLCPWTRAPYVQRFQHLISGHLLARTDEAEAATGAAGRAPGLVSLPVWWPGRFAPESGAPDVTVLATSVGPDADLWLADLPLAGISPRVLETWRNCYGVDLSPDFLAGQPLAVCGSFGAGRYLLSYSHLETPESPAANAWLARILRGFGIAVAGARPVPTWELDSETPFPPARKDGPAASARRACARIRALLELGVTQRLFFRRTSWLWGWRAGLPGMACNNLMAAFAELAEVAEATAVDPRRDPARAALDGLWARLGPRFDRLLDLFADGAESWFMASRRSDLRSPTRPHAVDARGLPPPRAALFGPPMRGG
ncbi:MAG: hypothetical protein K2N07_05935, partial [Desulfovibrio sp.]|nr:hypothetical protein [Desulfovibrio sp.]